MSFFAKLTRICSIQNVVQSQLVCNQHFWFVNKLMDIVYFIDMDVQASSSSGLVSSNILLEPSKCNNVISNFCAEIASISSPHT